MLRLSPCPYLHSHNHHIHETILFAFIIFYCLCFLLQWNFVSLCVHTLYRRFRVFRCYFRPRFLQAFFSATCRVLLSHYNKQTKTTTVLLKRNNLISLYCFVLCVSAPAKLSMPLSRREAFLYSGYISVLCLVHFSYAISRNVPFMIQRDVFVIKQFNKVFVT